MRFEGDFPGEIGRRKRNPIRLKFQPASTEKRVFCCGPTGVGGESIAA